MADKMVEVQRVDLSKYRQVTFREFDSQDAHVGDMLDGLNNLLASGWELIDARVGNWARPVSPKPKDEPPMLAQWTVYAFILGKK